MKFIVSQWSQAVCVYSYINDKLLHVNLLLISIQVTTRINKKGKILFVTLNLLFPEMSFFIPKKEKREREKESRLKSLLQSKLSLTFPFFELYAGARLKFVLM